MDLLAAAWNKLSKGSTVLPSKARIPDHCVEPSSAEALGGSLAADDCYFAITVNEIFLKTTRKWWTDFVPSVWTSASFSYAGQTVAVPYLIGPGLLKGNELGAPNGTLYRNERVAGFHPYKGGPISFSIVLNRIAAGNNAESVLSVVESTTGAFGVATQLLPYISAARAVTRGLEVLLDMGSAPVIGLRDTLAPDANGQAGSRPGYYALLDAPDDGSASAPQQLFIIEGGLFAGSNPTAAKPVRDRSYVLYNIATVRERNDVSQLVGVQEQWEKVEELAQRPSEENWDAAKAFMTELGIRLSRHPDLVRRQANTLYIAWANEMLELHQQRVIEGPKSVESSDEDQTIQAIIKQMASL